MVSEPDGVAASGFLKVGSGLLEIVDYVGLCRFGDGDDSVPTVLGVPQRNEAAVEVERLECEAEGLAASHSASVK